jgi:hypothetical protein
MDKDKNEWERLHYVPSHMHACPATGKLNNTCGVSVNSKQTS